MTITVQSSAGDVANANSYVTVAEFKSYCDGMKFDYSIVDDDTYIEAGLVKALRYMEGRFRSRTKGEIMLSGQTTTFPRRYLYDELGAAINGIPQQIKDAQCEYAFRALATDLAPDPVTDSTGAKVLSRSQSVGSLSESVTYEAGGGVSTLRPYPVADMMVTPYLKPGGVMRN